MSCDDIPKKSMNKFLFICDLGRKTKNKVGKLQKIHINMKVLKYRVQIKVSTRY